MAAELKKNFSVETELIPSSHGVFEVVVNGSNIFSKKQIGRFPEHREIIENINSMN